MKPFLIIVFCLLCLSAFGNLWQHNNPEEFTITVTDTLTVFEQLPADTIIAEVVKYRYRTIADTGKIDSLEAVLDSVMQELADGEIREYVDNIKFDTGDSLRTTIKGILFEPVAYIFYPAPNEIKIVTNNTTTYKDSRDDVWFTLVPTLGVKVAPQSLFTDADLLLMFKHYGVGVTFGYEWNHDNFYKGVKVAKVWDVPKIKFLR